MEREETKKILSVIIASYPNYKPSDLQLTMNVWHEILKDYPYGDMIVALKSYITTDTSGFAPSIGQLVGMYSKLSVPKQMNESEAWALVRKALSNGIYSSQEEFDALPELVQKAVGNANQLYVWACDPDYNESVISSHFISAYKRVCNEHNEVSRMPKEARAKLEQLYNMALGQ